MKNRGFTLIELLAVLVILTIIALIAVPIVINIIDNARNSANKRSVELYARAVELAIQESKIKHIYIPDGIYTLNNGQICNEEETSKCITVEVNGTEPNSYAMTIKNGIIIEQIIQLKPNSQKYIKPTNGEFKEITVTKATGNVPQGNYAAGDEYIIHIGGEDRIFFVLGENTDDSNKVDLIMNKNIGNLVAWCNNETLCKTNSNWDNTKGPITATAYLQSQTSNWEIIPTLPTKEQIQGAYTGNMPTWMYDYLNNTTHSVSGLSGYWTNSFNTQNSTDAWVVYREGRVSSSYIITTNGYGIRPVITVSKFLLD